MVNSHFSMNFGVQVGGPKGAKGETMATEQVEDLSVLFLSACRKAPGYPSAQGRGRQCWHGQAGLCSARGSAKRKLAPLPGIESTVSRPPWASAMPRAR